MVLKEGSGWDFDVPPNEAVVTTTYVVKDGLPVLYVSHEIDDEGAPSWQFHCGNGEYGADVIQLVSLSELLRLDPSLTELARLPAGYSARRESAGTKWALEAEQ